MHRILQALLGRFRHSPTVTDQRDEQIKWVDRNAEPNAVKRQAVEEIRSARAGHPVDEGGGD